MEQEGLTVKERQILLVAESSANRRSTWYRAFYFTGIAFCAFYLGSSVTDVLGQGGQHTFELVKSTVIIACFMGLLYEHTKFQREAFSLIRKLAERTAEFED